MYKEENAEHTCGMERTSCGGIAIEGRPGDNPSVRPRVICSTAKVSIAPDHERLFSLAVRDAGPKARLFTDDYEVVNVVNRRGVDGI